MRDLDLWRALYVATIIVAAIAMISLLVRACNERERCEASGGIWVRGDFASRCAEPRRP